MLSSDSSCFLTKHLKNLDPSYKTNLDLWDYLGRLKLIAKFHWTDLVICSQSREGKTPSYSQINMVFNNGLQCILMKSILRKLGPVEYSAHLLQTF